MGRVIFYSASVIVVVGVLVFIGVVIGGGWGASEAGSDFTELAHACIGQHGGSVTTEQLDACIATAASGGE
ncbi:hypothetical protein [Serinibacter salmoneus]|uniref:Uncharacterized protein n=1 Tax=Serinibacter salmoneus TaxID=556530 RepID=A0A2A9D230_9MICO|nr:hypothetical protein [Serinibacter salmoneus]PFG20713.1 hypothetical protein ATL40_2323 [Serinibacter salmoneus]